MNLAFLVSREVVSHGRYQFTKLQNILYEELKNAIMSETTFVIPSDELARQCGKSVVINKLADEFNLPILRHNGFSYFYSHIGDGASFRRISSDSLRGRGVRTILVDEGLSESQFQRYIRDIPPRATIVGVGEMQVSNNGDTSEAIKRIEKEISQYRQTIGGVDYARQNTEPFNQRIHDMFFEAIW